MKWFENINDFKCVNEMWKGPMFEDFDPLVRVDPSDSDFVDAYHTNAGTLLSAAFGIWMSSG